MDQRSIVIQRSSIRGSSCRLIFSTYMNHYDDLQKLRFYTVIFGETEVEIDHFRQPLLQFRNLSERGGFLPAIDA